jgi:hypothetical protein
MSLNANSVGRDSKPRVAQANLAPDVYLGRVVQIIDLGLQPQRAFQGKEKPPANEISITYELAEEFMKDEDGKELKDKPRWISEDLPFYGLFADKAKSTLRYHAFDPTMAYDGDFAKCVDTPVNITVVNNKSGDRIYDNVANVSPMSEKKKANLPPLVNKPKVFDLDRPDMEVFNSLPKWIQDKIKGNLNFQGSPLQKALGGVAHPQQEPAKADVDNNPY